MPKPPLSSQLDAPLRRCSPAAMSPRGAPSRRAVKRLVSTGLPRQGGGRRLCTARPARKGGAACASSGESARPAA